ncbi:RING finger protein 141-like [Myripristis murdjan]|uniref:RING finger protein 141-like n=1 Tax=Myripristis murdjan TaxID=586833 RepID=UPI00117615BE|nr:RING finger protein 141-like [Myripristis murdjan]
MGITNKINDALEDSVILTDGQGNQILDTEGTRGSAFWKQNARKVCAVKEGDLQQLQGSKKRRLSRRDDNGLDAVLDTIEKVVLAAQGLQEVSATIKELANLASSNRRTTVSLTEAEAAAIRDAFACVVCKGPVVEPMVSSCCHSIVGCQRCVEQWQENSAFCPKCRADDFDINTQKLTGLSDALAALGNILCQ